MFSPSCVGAVLIRVGGLGVFYAGHPCYGRPGDKTLKHACVHKCREPSSCRRQVFEYVQPWARGEMLGSPCDDDEIDLTSASRCHQAGLAKRPAGKGRILEAHVQQLRRLRLTLGSLCCLLLYVAPNANSAGGSPLVCTGSFE